MAIAGEADPSAVVELSNWFDEVYKPAISQVEGVRLVRRFEVIGEPNKFVALIDVETPDVCSSDRYLERREQSGAERRFGKLRNLIARIYEQEAK